MYYRIMAALIAFYMGVAGLFYTPSPVREITPEGKGKITASGTLTVMTYNLKTTGTGNKTVKNREPLVLENIEVYAPDSIGFEEANEEWVDYLAANMKNYAHVGIGRDKGGKGEASPVFYRKDKYKLLEGDTFWLSKTPEKVSKGWDAFFFNRVCSYAVLKNKKTGLIYAHFNAHFDHLGVVARLESASLVCDRIAAVNDKYGGIPVFLSGDLNDDEGSEMYKRIEESGMKDVKFIAKETMDAGTYHGYSKLTEKLRTKPIDFIFVSGYCKEALSYKVDYTEYGGIYPSDHHPVIARLTVYNRK